MTLPFSTEVTLDGGGAASTLIGPVPTFTRWLITRISVTGNSAAIPTVNVYRGSTATAGNFLDGTNSGNRDSADYPNPVELHAGETLFVTWTGGTAAATQAVRVEGQQVGFP